MKLSFGWLSQLLCLTHQIQAFRLETKERSNKIIYYQQIPSVPKIFCKILSNRGIPCVETPESLTWKLPLLCTWRVVCGTSPTRSGYTEKTYGSTQRKSTHSICVVWLWNDFCPLNLVRIFSYMDYVLFLDCCNLEIALYLRLFAALY